MRMVAGGRDGFTLIGVLVFCLLLIPVCASLARSSRDFAHGVRGDVDGFAQALLVEGLAEAVAARIGSDRELFDRLAGGPLACAHPGHDFTLFLRDHDGKIDLNNAGSELLLAGFEAAGLDRGRALLLQQFVESSRSNGAVPREISGLVEKIGLKHAPFEHVAEIQDMLAALDVPPVDMDALFTVNRGAANIERSTAAPDLRNRLRTLSDEGVVFEDNGNFDYVDIVVHARATANGRSLAVGKTYRKISPLGDVIEIQGSRVVIDRLPADSARPDCAVLLGIREAG